MHHLDGYLFYPTCLERWNSGSATCLHTCTPPFSFWVRYRYRAVPALPFLRHSLPAVSSACTTVSGYPLTTSTPPAVTCWVPCGTCRFLFWSLLPLPLLSPPFALPPPGPPPAAPACRPFLEHTAITDTTLPFLFCHRLFYLPGYTCQVFVTGLFYLEYHLPRVAFTATATILGGCVTILLFYLQPGLTSPVSTAIFCHHHFPAWVPYLFTTVSPPGVCSVQTPPLGDYHSGRRCLGTLLEFPAISGLPALGSVLHWATTSADAVLEPAWVIDFWVGVSTAFLPAFFYHFWA